MNHPDWLACDDARSLSRELDCRLSVRQSHLFAAACLRRVWKLLDREATRRAVEAVELYADNRIRRDALLEAWNRAELEHDEGVWRGRYCDDYYWCPCTQQSEDARAESGDILLAVQTAAAEPSWTAARAAFYARELAAWQAGPEQRAAAAEREREAQFAIMLDFLGDTPLYWRVPAAWLARNDGTVVRVARAIYQERNFGALPVLADALLDAGCDEEDLLRHCRRPSPHARGCWAVDLILGKEQPPA